MKKGDLKKNIELIAKEKDISEDYLFDAMELALNSAYKKNYRLPNSRVEINRNTGEIKIFSFKTVVLDETHKERIDEMEFDSDEELSNEELEDLELEDLPEEKRIHPFIFNDKLHITLAEAQKIVPDIKVGETIET